MAGRRRLAADTLCEAGGQLAALSPETMARLEAILPRDWSHADPVDILGDAPGPLYGKALDAILVDPGQDAVLVMNCPQAVADGLDAARPRDGGERGGAARRGRPDLLAGASARRADSRRLFAARGMPTYQTPDESVRAFMQLVDYRRNQELLMQTPPAILPGVADGAAARAVLSRARGEGRQVLTEPEAKALLAAYGIPVARTEIARDPDAAAEVSKTIGNPVALKILSPDITHKSDVGGVRLELDSPDMVREAASHMLKLVAERRPEAASRLHRPGP